MERVKALFRKYGEDAKKKARPRPLRIVGFILKWVIPLAYVVFILYDPTEKISWLRTGGMGLLVVFILVYFFHWKKKLHDALLMEKTVERLDFAKMNSIKLSIYYIIDTAIKLATLGIVYWLMWQIYQMSQFTLVLLNIILWCEIIGHGICLVDFLLNIGQEQLDEEATRL